MCVAIVSSNTEIRRRLRHLVTFLNRKVYGFSDALCLIQMIDKRKEEVDSVLYYLGDVFDKISFKTLILLKTSYIEADIIVISNASLAGKNDYRFDRSLKDIGVHNLYATDKDLDYKLTEMLKIKTVKKKRKIPRLPVIILTFLVLYLGTVPVLIRTHENNVSDKMYRDVRERVVQDYLQTQGYFNGEPTERGSKVVVIEEQDTIKVSFKGNGYETDQGDQ